MLSLELLKGQIGKYDSGKISLGQFEDWLYEVSVDPIQDNSLADLVDKIDSALSARHFHGLGEDGLRRRLMELASAARPFVLRDEIVGFVVYRQPDQHPKHSRMATAAAAAAIVLSGAPQQLRIHYSRDISGSAVIADGDRPFRDAASASSSIAVQVAVR